MDRVRFNVNILTEFEFRFRIYLLLDWLPYLD